MRPLFLASLCLCAFALSCTASYHPRTAPPVGKLLQYDSVIVESVDAKPWLDRNPSVRDDALYEKWRSEIQIASTNIPANLKEYLVRHLRLESPPTEKSFTVRLELIQFNPDRSSKGRIGVRATLVDSNTGEEIGSADAHGSIIVGGFRNAYVACARGVARFILDHRR